MGVEGEYLAGALLAVGLHHRLPVLRLHTVVGVNAGLAAVVVVAVLETGDARVLEHFIGGAEGRDDLRLRALIHRVRRQAGDIVLRRLHHRLVGHHGVHGVVEIFQEELPVAIVLVAQHAAGHFHLALGGPVAEVVEAGQGSPHPGFQVGGIRVQGGKYEAAVAVAAGRRLHVVHRVLEVEAGVLIAALIGDLEQGAIRVEGPAVVTAAKGAGVAAGGVHQLGPLVGTAVVQYMYLAMAIAGHHHRNLVVDVGGVEIAGIRHLAFMAYEYPGLAPDALHLQLKNVRVGIDAAMQAGGFHQPAQVLIAVSHVNTPSAACL